LFGNYLPDTQKQDEKICSRSILIFIATKSLIRVEKTISKTMDRTKTKETKKKKCNVGEDTLFFVCENPFEIHNLKVLVSSPF
jgi:hypothetical protein